MKKSFKLYSDSLDVLDELTDEQAGQLFKAIREYENSEKEILTGLMRAIFIPFKNNIDRAKVEYEAVCERNRENGAKGGRPNQNKPSGLKANPNNPDKDKDKDKDKEKEEIPHTPFSFQEEIKSEDKPVVNQNLKSMIENSSKSENKVITIINYYRDNISSRNEDIQEQASYNQILIKNYDMDKMLIGLENYKRYLEVSKKAPMKLFFFIRDAIYNDYKVENVVATGKNIAVVPKDLVGKRFIIDGEEIEFENDGYNKVGKDWKVTNAKNVDEMVKLVRGEK